MQEKKRATTLAQQVAITPFAPANMDQAMTLAEKMASSGLMPSALRGKPQDVLIVMMTGRELGLSPMQAIRSMHVIEGKASMSAEMMVALCHRHADICEYFRLVQSDATKATYETKRRGQALPVRMSFTMEQAKAAGVTGKDNWKKWPEAMLRARCSSSLARAVYSDLLAGVYSNDDSPSAGAPEPGLATSQAGHAVLETTAVSASEPAAVEEEKPKGRVKLVPLDEAQPPTEEPQASAQPETEPGEVAILRSKIAVATSQEGLRALVAEIKTVAEPHLSGLREAYSMKAGDLGSAATKREPGDEG